MTLAAGGEVRSQRGERRGELILRAVERPAVLISDRARAVGAEDNLGAHGVRDGPAERPGLVGLEPGGERGGGGEGGEGELPVYGLSGGGEGGVVPGGDDREGGSGASQCLIRYRKKCNHTNELKTR